MAATGVHQQRRLVRVWFGEHVIVNKTADEAFANRFAEAMQRRFISLRVTNDPIASPPLRAESPSISRSTRSVDGRGSR